jgi:hypothetical protein
VIKNYKTYIKETVDRSDVDPYGEEQWEEDIIGKTFYYVRGEGKNIEISKIFCNKLSQYGYYEFCLNNKREKINLVITEGNIYVVKSKEDIDDRLSYLIPEDKPELFSIVFDYVLDRFKKTNLERINSEIENLEKNKTKIEKFTKETILDTLRKRGLTNL